MGLPEAGGRRDLAADPAAQDLASLDLIGVDQPSPGACPSAKVAFDRATACGNDGSNEFCIPAASAIAAIDEITRNVPTIFE